MKIAVFASGKGSNLISLYEKSFIYGSYSIGCVVSDKLHCGALEFAKGKSIPVFNSFSQSGLESFRYQQIESFLETYNISLIVLAGYLKLFPKFLLQKYKDRVINIHPALLPFFGGSGLYGDRVHQAVFASGMKISGVTIHFVNEEYDKGQIIAQESCDISDIHDADEIASRVLMLEHSLLPRVVHNFAITNLAAL